MTEEEKLVDLLLTGEERMAVGIPCETKCQCPMPRFDAVCADCIAVCHGKAQLSKVLKAGYVKLADENKFQPTQFPPFNLADEENRAGGK